MLATIELGWDWNRQLWLNDYQTIIRTERRNAVQNKWARLQPKRTPGDHDLTMHGNQRGGEAKTNTSCNDAIDDERERTAMVTRRCWRWTKRPQWNKTAFASQTDFQESQLDNTQQSKQTRNRYEYVTRVLAAKAGVGGVKERRRRELSRAKDEFDHVRIRLGSGQVKRKIRRIICQRKTGRLPRTQEQALGCDGEIPFLLTAGSLSPSY